MNFCKNLLHGFLTIGMKRYLICPLYFSKIMGNPFSSDLYSFNPYPHFHSSFAHDYAPIVKCPDGNHYNTVDGKRIMVDGWGCVTCGRVEIEKSSQNAVHLGEPHEKVQNNFWKDVPTHYKAEAEIETLEETQRYSRWYSDQTRDGMQSWITLSDVIKHCGEKCVHPEYRERQNVEK